MNLLERLKTDFSRFEEKPFNELDAAVFTQLAMLRVELPACANGGFRLQEDGFLAASDQPQAPLDFALSDLLRAEHFDSLFTGLAAEHVKQCLFAAAMSPRYRDVRITRYQTVLDLVEGTQFAATTFECDEFVFVGFRGTDATLVGWREDFNLCYMNPIPSQVLGLNYVKTQKLPEDGRPFYLGGHSKGGNVAEYVLLTASDELKARMAKVFSFDGPGFKRDAFTEQEFQATGLIFDKVVPQDSVIGMILDSSSPFQVTTSKELGIMQHDLFSWELEGDAFVRREGLTVASETVDIATRNWVHSYSDQELSSFVNILFDAMDASGAFDLYTLFGEVKQAIQYLRAIAASVDDDKAAVLKRFASDLADALGETVAAQAEDTLKTAHGKATKWLPARVREGLMKLPELKPKTRNNIPKSPY